MATYPQSGGKRVNIIIRESGVRQQMGGREYSHAVQLVDNIFAEALEGGCSDIHLHPEHDKLTCRLRVDGVLHHFANIPLELAPNVIARIKLAAQMAIDERRVPQDGRIELEYMGRRLSARCSCLPSLNGENIVMRLLDPQAMKVDLEVLGMARNTHQAWMRAIAAPYGMILVTGPTGSGKTSTLYASINKLDRMRRNIVTVEDPIEYEFPDNVTQVQVTEKMTFPHVMRTFLRQDPDVMMVGEMRDPESLSIGIRAGLTGHLVLTTLHTNNAVETIGRMKDMGGEPYLIAAVTVAIMAQRLVRLNCEKCKEAYMPDPSEFLPLGLSPEEGHQATFYRGKGCANCRGTGFKGRTGIFELLMLTPEIRDAIATNANLGEVARLCKQQGMTTMLEDGRNKVLRGLTTHVLH
jgi:type II secretory ATPase GspE/PulE/Tfp pilus assembly ATPase PilB-like protein